jgi:hypothetical protein
LAGQSGQAISTASNASNTEEQADYLQFTLNGVTVKGWVWRSPFKEGDNVDVAAEWQIGHYEIFGIARPSDRMIALYPHCSRGRARHIKNAIKWWLIFSVIGTGVSLLPGFSADRLFKDIFILGSACLIRVGIIIFALCKQWMPFVRLSEKIFNALGFPDAGNMDLIKSSKAQRTANDPAELGIFYFHY